MRLGAGIDEVWRAVLAAGPARGELAGLAGTALLEEADDDAHIAVFRLQAAAGTATATLTVALSAVANGTVVGLQADAHGVDEAALLDAVRAAALRATLPGEELPRLARAFPEATPALPEPAPAAAAEVSPGEPSAAGPLGATTKEAPVDVAADATRRPAPAEAAAPLGVAADAAWARAPAAPDDAGLPRGAKVAVAAGAALLALVVVRGRR